MKGKVRPVVGAWAHAHSHDGTGRSIHDYGPHDLLGNFVNMDSGAWVGGKLFTALKFDGSRDYIALHEDSLSAADLGMPQQYLSVSLWAKPKVLPPPYFLTTQPRPISRLCTLTKPLTLPFIAHSGTSTTKE